MKSTVLKYGSFSGILMAVLVLGLIPFSPQIGFGLVNTMLFLGEIVAFVPVFFGIRFFRKTMGEGYITFGKAFAVGILIVFIACIFYAVCWNLLYFWISPDLPAKLSAYVIEQMKLHGSTPKDIAIIQKQFDDSKKILANPFVNAAIAFTDPIETGIIMTLIFSAILRKKPPTLELGRLN